MGAFVVGRSKRGRLNAAGRRSSSSFSVAAPALSGSRPPPRLRGSRPVGTACTSPPRSDAPHSGPFRSKGRAGSRRLLGSLFGNIGESQESASLRELAVKFCDEAIDDAWSKSIRNIMSPFVVELGQFMMKSGRGIGGSLPTAMVQAPLDSLDRDQIEMALTSSLAVESSPLVVTLSPEDCTTVSRALTSILDQCLAIGCSNAPGKRWARRSRRSAQPADSLRDWYSERQNERDPEGNGPRTPLIVVGRAVEATSWVVLEGVLCQLACLLHGRGSDEPGIPVGVILFISTVEVFPAGSMSREVEANLCVRQFEPPPPSAILDAFYAQLFAEGQLPVVLGPQLLQEFQVAFQVDHGCAFTIRRSLERSLRLHMLDKYSYLCLLGRDENDAGKRAEVQLMRDRKSEWRRGEIAVGNIPETDKQGQHSGASRLASADSHDVEIVVKNRAAVVIPTAWLLKILFPGGCSDGGAEPVAMNLYTELLVASRGSVWGQGVKRIERLAVSELEGMDTKGAINLLEHLAALVLRFDTRDAHGIGSRTSCLLKVFKALDGQEASEKSGVDDTLGVRLKGARTHLCALLMLVLDMTPLPASPDFETALWCDCEVPERLAPFKHKAGEREALFSSMVVERSEDDVSLAFQALESLGGNDDVDNWFQSFKMKCQDQSTSSEGIEERFLHASAALVFGMGFVKRSGKRAKIAIRAGTSAR